MSNPPLIPPTWQLPDAFTRRIGSSVGRQRLMEHEQQLLIIAHEVPERGEARRRGILFWRMGKQDWKASNGEPGGVALQNLLMRYEKALEVYEQEEAKAESADEYLPLLDGLAPILRSSRNLHKVLQEARKAAADSRVLIDARDRIYELSRTAELLYQDARNNMDIAVVRRAEEQSISSNQMSAAAHRLNLMVALFFPLATLGSIFGTSLTDNWSWSQSPLPFAIFLCVGLISGFVLAAFITPTRKSVKS